MLSCSLSHQQEQLVTIRFRICPRVCRPDARVPPDDNRSEEAQMSGIDKLKNKAQELTGEGKEAAGKATDDRDLQAEGHKDQAAGNAKQAGEKVKDIFK
jgi:uncharacterized protein YjbJ (UPF0337 family)